MGFQQGFRINTNTSSLDTYRNYSASQAGLERNIERLSSGLRINKAADDSAGLSISNRMNNQIRGMQQANRNVQQGNNMLQTAEGGLNEISNILSRMRELAVQSASDTVDGTDGGTLTATASKDRGSIDQEFDALMDEINRIAEATEYNGVKLLTGNFDGLDATAGAADTASVATLQVGADNDAEDQIDIHLGNFSLALAGGATSGTNLGNWGGTEGTTAAASGGADLRVTNADKLNLGNQADAQTTITTLDAMIDTVNNGRGQIGAYQNRLEYTSSNLMNSIQNNAASMSTIRDADFAAEAADLAKNQILVQSGTAMLAQANGLSQNVLSLIR
jgi:flagellin